MSPDVPSIALKPPGLGSAFGGGDITATTYPDDDHFSLPQHAIGEAKDWLAARFT